MKKFLSLVMALAMTLTLVTVGASAKDFTDGSSITYGEAVNVISGIGVVDGYTDGSFNPTATLTRGAAAKIICNMILGPSTASALGVTSAPFSDVPVSNVFAGYIAYCAQAGIINGYGDGTFHPTATVTGYQFMKMLLGALGYDGSIEGFTGANWTVNVAKLAISIGLDKGNSNFVGSKAMTREEAALYAFNTLFATEVKYDTKGTTITVNGATVVTGASSAESVYSAADYASNLKDDAVSGVAGSYYVQFGEEHFKTLTADPVYSEGQVGRIISYKGDTVSEFGATGTVLATKAGSTAYSNLTTSTDSKYIGYKADTTVTYVYNDGEASLSYPNTVVDVATNIATIQSYVGTKGVVVNFIDTDSNGKYDVVSVVKATVDTVTGTPKTTTSGVVTKVTIPGVVSTATDVTLVDYPTDLVKDDVVLVYTSASTGVKHIEKAAVVSGTVTGIKSTTDYTLDSSTTYTESGLVSAGSGIVSSDAALGNSVNFYLDKGGYVVATDKVSTAAVNYALVLDYDAPTMAGQTVKLLMTDGTVKVISAKVGDADTNTYLATSAAAGYTVVAKPSAVKYSITDDVYYLTLLSAATSSAAGTQTIDQVKKSTASLVAADSSVVADTDTVFIYRNTSNSVSVYTGIANTPSITSGSSFVSIGTGSVADYVFVLGAAYASSTATDLFYVADAAPTVTGTTSKPLYTYDVLKNGELTTVTFSSDVSATINAAGAYEITSYDADGYAKTVSDSATGTGDFALAQAKSLSNGTLTYGTSSSILVDDSTVIVKVDTSDNSMTIGDLSDISATNTSGETYSKIAVYAALNSDGTATTNVASVIFVDGTGTVA